MFAAADDRAPQASKTLWLAAFYLCIPSGYAIGYLLGGLIATPLGWRAPFLLEAAIMVPFVGLCACLPPLKLVGTESRGMLTSSCALSAVQSPSSCLLCPALAVT